MNAIRPVTRKGECPFGDDPSQMEASFVTILFTDLVGSASLFDDLGDEEADALRREHFDTLRARSPSTTAARSSRPATA